MPARDYFNSASSLALGVLLGAGGVAASAYVTRASWLPMLVAPAAEAKKEDPHAGHDHGPPGERVKLSVQAQANLGLVVDALIPESYERMLTIPGTVEDRPGISDRNVIAPLAGVVTSVHVQPGDTLQSGETLFTMRILSEAIQTAQTELFKSTKDLQLTVNNLKLLREIPKGGIAESKIIEVENQEQKLKTAVTAARHDLLSRGFRLEQIDAVAGGKFLVEVTVVAPDLVGPVKPVAIAVPKIVQTSNGERLPTFELKELKVQVGEQVQAGQVLSVLANHRQLYIEGRGFKSESALLAKAAQSGWLVRAEFNEEGNEWAAYSGELKIRHLANTVDPVSRTFAFYIPLENQSKTYVRDGQTFLNWRFRPGQRVRLRVPVEKFADDVFVLPAGAVVREGGEAYVFRQNGDLFDRKPVKVLYEDRIDVVLANDGSVGPGEFIVRNQAAALNRALKAAASGGGGGHEGHDH